MATASSVVMAFSWRISRRAAVAASFVTASLAAMAWISGTATLAASFVAASTTSSIASSATTHLRSKAA
jgi:hypothetical protein